MSRVLSIGVGLIFSLLLSANVGNARDQIQVTGSSTVLPYQKIVAETFGEIYPHFKVPVIESGGTGAGIKEFCRGIGENTVDIVNASRAMKSSELQSCFEAGVKDIEEIRIGYDGIVFATDIKGPDWKLRPVDVYKALAARVIIDGKLQPNNVLKWSAVNSALPDWTITAYIPGEKHGTREVFEEKLLAVGCKESGAVEVMKSLGMDDKKIHAACIAVRKDGKAVDIDGDYSETLARLTSNKTGVGIFGLSFYQNNADRLKVADINGFAPTVETISSGQYPVSRPLFFYIKKAHLDIIPGLREYVDFFLSEQMIGPDSPLAEYGLIVAPEKERQAQRSNFSAGRIMMLK
ncbi:PstS family phosphate ABC transporter substrate-binding protein [Bartonella krasnovii]|uniref:Phosphonate ABC transporter substrate-binding protein n=1 Tax=Bartonella krasnovii TaxID=2267275 RepID=A0A5B9CZJ4_9HYPH|nr:substrate-binding domain-containing protein [Bartonella krasnovii]QEE11572.1 phosphonate ABC transporter substrate-binding protein [Bartonella krasnovii]UNF29325.1 substrate-binding domain-containing protein [Bartonella krasnovii]UNF35682.1 substrate-binding domain-containing protein [Bartonella krasnovii]UNF37303.1 substrate-binding domain-containing protein [Bartonella krasnovii]UNF38995.1 substrate-binding domain-containing protein [Bartonella krasnovii]